MPKTFVDSGETLTALSSRVFNGEWERFTEILDLNPDIDIFEGVSQQLEVVVPEIEQILKVAQPALGSVRSAIAGISPSTANTISQIEGYAQEAIALVNEINGVVKDAEAVIEGVVDESRSYKNKLVQLVPWLLAGN